MTIQAVTIQAVTIQAITIQARTIYARAIQATSAWAISIWVINLQIAEELYQKGLLSYPRTETDKYNKDMDLMELCRNQVPSPAWGAFASGLVDQVSYI